MIRSFIHFSAWLLSGFTLTANATSAGTRFDQILGLHMAGPVSEQGAAHRAPATVAMVCFERGAPDQPLTMTVKFRPSDRRGEIVLFDIQDEQAAVPLELAHTEHRMTSERINGFSGPVFVARALRNQSMLETLRSRDSGSSHGLTLALHVPSQKLLFTLFESNNDDSAEIEKACEVREKFKLVCIQADIGA